MAQQPVLSPRFPAGEVGPGGRQDRQVNAATIVLPDATIDHIRADGKADSPQRRRDNQRQAAGMKPKPLPKNQVALAVNMQLAVGGRESQGIKEMSAGSLDEAGGDGHLPLTATLTQIGKCRPLGGLAVRSKIGAQAIAGVKQLR